GTAFHPCAPIHHPRAPAPWTREDFEICPTHTAGSSRSSSSSTPREKSSANRRAGCRAGFINDGSLRGMRINTGHTPARSSESSTTRARTASSSTSRTTIQLGASLWPNPISSRRAGIRWGTRRAPSARRCGSARISVRSLRGMSMSFGGRGAARCMRCGRIRFLKALSQRGRTRGVRISYLMLNGNRWPPDLIPFRKTCSVSRGVLLKTLPMCSGQRHRTRTNVP
ncbi:hypothetical protein C8R45DRAFT_1144751, partial [Mycena sanguinolenta]